MKAALVAATVGVLLVIWLAFCAWKREDGTDWNPLVLDDSQLEGKWLADTAELQLMKGRYLCSGAGCPECSTQGKWFREGDFYVRFETDSGKVQVLRLGIRESHLVVAAGATASDPDLWHPNVKFTKQHPWLSQ